MVAGAEQRRGDGQDERMGGCDAKYTHLSTPRARSLLCDSPSLGQAELKTLYKRTGMTAALLAMLEEYIYFLPYNIYERKSNFPISTFGPTDLRS